MGKINFEQPPLAEVSFGILFAPIKDLRTSHFGMFWARLRPEFTQTVDRALVGDTDPDEAVAVPGWFPLPRVMFLHKDGEQLLQLQPNRFYFNWRRSQPATPYPRFDALEPVFRRYFDHLTKFLRDESLGAVDVVGAELAYVNHIPSGEGWTGIDQIGEVFPDLRWSARQPAQGQPQAFAWHGSFERPAVRLEADVKFARAQDRVPDRFLFELRALSRDKLASLEAVHEWFCRANDTIVSGFLDLTSKKMQKEIWRRVADA